MNRRLPCIPRSSSHRSGIRWRCRGKRRRRRAGSARRSLAASPLWRMTATEVILTCSFLAIAVFFLALPTRNNLQWLRMWVDDKLFITSILYWSVFTFNGMILMINVFLLRLFWKFTQVLLTFLEEGRQLASNFDLDFALGWQQKPSRFIVSMRSNARALHSSSTRAP